MDKAYLVMAAVKMIDGSVLTSFDVFRAVDAEEALNYTRNIFIKEARGAVVFGNVTYIADAIGAMTAEVVAVVDLADPENAKLLNSADAFDSYLDTYEKRQETRLSEPVP